MLFKGLLVLSCLSAAAALGNSVRPLDLWDPQWTWTCVQETVDGPSCQRQPYDNNTGPGEYRVSPDVCFLTCGPHRALWPYPTIKADLGTALTTLIPSNIKLVSVESPDAKTEELIRAAAELTLGHITKTYTVGIEESTGTPRTKDLKAGDTNLVNIHLKVLNADAVITLDTDESYSLKLTAATGEPEVLTLNITANTFFGVRHGLETFTQLIAFNEYLGYLQILNQADIEDAPKYRYRGLLIDTGRNFIPISALKKMVDAMAYNKLNMFHWHLSDSNSMPFVSKRVPQVTNYGTFSPTKVYTPEQVTEFIAYANIRGVKIIPELDGPSHAGNGWQWGPLEGLGELSLCVNAEPYRDYCIQPPCGQLNPLNNNTLDVLGMLFQDFLDVFDRDFFHMGNDEISFKCWMNYTEILDWLEDHQTNDLMELWGLFQNRALQKLKDANEGKPISAIIWTSEMTDVGRRFVSPDDYVIQIWHKSNDSQIAGILNDDYRVIFSNQDYVYLDHGFGPWRGNPVDYATMHYWQSFYSYDIGKIVEAAVGKDKGDELFAAGKIFGGEATLWSEKNDEHTMEMKLWPRSAAFAERLWSNPQNVQPNIAYPRLLNHRLRMIHRGVRPDALAPESCHYIWGFCH